MQVTSKQVRILHATLGWIAARPKEAAASFYRHLFELAPETRDLFVFDLERQGDKLIATLSTIVLRIEDWPSIEPDLIEMGMRHVAYGVQQKHYPVTEQALLAMLKDMGGEHFDAEVETAWRAAYALMAGVMSDAINRRLGGALLER